MKRRQFLGASAASATLLALDVMPKAIAATPANTSTAPFTPPKKSPLYKEGDWRQPLRAIRGVNLGGWLILEKWMTASLFDGTTAGDEYAFSQIPGGRERIERHRDTWITEADFRWIAEYGLDAVRLPVGFWSLNETPPYVGAARHIQNAFDWAQKYDLKVLLDLHGAPGSQNGMDHSGHSGEIGWTKPENIAATTKVLQAMAEKYGNHPNLWGLELLNEPRWDISIDTLHDFYTAAYKVLRPMLPESVAISSHDGFRMSAWEGFAPSPEFTNFVLDTHVYQVFTDGDRKRSPQEQVQMALNRRDELTNFKGPWLIVGEWSIALPWNPNDTRTPFERDALKLAYSGAQLMAFEATHGWFYWSYKTETGGDWSFRDCVEQGTMPKSMALS